MISAPSIFGKLPGYGDFIRHNASLAQVDVWRSWFEQAVTQWSEKGSPDLRTTERGLHRCRFQAGAEVRPALQRTQPCYFVLKASCLDFPAAGGYVIGVLAASCDRVGRRYPLVIWQSANAHWAEQLLLAPARWLTDLAQMLHDHVQQCGQHGLAARVDALWLAHQPRWRDRIGAPYKRLGDDAYLNIGGLAAPVVREGKGMRADWPQNLYRYGSFGSVWQAGADSVLAIDGVSLIRNIIAAIS